MKAKLEEPNQDPWCGEKPTTQSETPGAMICACGPHCSVAGAGILFEPRSSRCICTASWIETAIWHPICLEEDILSSVSVRSWYWMVPRHLKETNTKKELLFTQMVLEKATDDMEGSSCSPDGLISWRYLRCDPGIYFPLPPNGLTSY